MRHAREMQLQMLDGQRFDKTENQNAFQVHARGLVLAAAQDKIVVVEPKRRQTRSVLLLSYSLLFSPQRHKTTRIETYRISKCLA